MSDRKRDRVDEVSTQLEEMRPTLDLRMSQAPAPIEAMMEQAIERLSVLPTAAQLAVLRSFLPEMLASLDANDRAFWARELIGEGVPEIPTLTV